MKIVLIVGLVLLGLVIVFQVYIVVSTSKTEIQKYNVIKDEGVYEIRYYPAALMAKISSTSTSYRDLGYSGFGKLAKYIFGGNSENKQIAMTSPVHMDIGDSSSTMAFVMPSSYKREDLPKPNSEEVVLEDSEAEYVAVIRFGGFGSASSIDEYKVILKNALDERGLAYYGNFRYLGYNPPYQLIGRRNEVIVALDPSSFENSEE